MKTATKTYNQLYLNCIGHIRNYQEDLTKHDYNTIHENPKKEFIHITRELGTAIILIRPFKDFLNNLQHAKDYMDFNKTYIEYYLGDEFKNKIIIQYYNGKSLIKITEQTARDIFNKYYDSITNQIQQRQNENI